MDRRASLKGLALGLSLLRGLGFLRGAEEEFRSGEGGKAQPRHEGSTYQRIKTYLDSIPSIDMHEHLRAFDELLYVETAQGRGMNLCALWQGSYLTRISSITPWKPGTPFEAWWQKAQNDFADVRATDFYRYIALALHDFYEVDFDRITPSEARELYWQVIDPQGLYCPMIPTKFISKDGRKFWLFTAGNPPVKGWYKLNMISVSLEVLA